MKIRVTDEQIKNIEKYKKYMLMLKGHLFVIQEYTITEEEWKPLFQFGKPRMAKYLTDAVVQCYHAEGDFQAILTDYSLSDFFIYTNFEKMRLTWLTFSKEIRTFGFTIVRTPKDQSDASMKEVFDSIFYSDKH